MHLNILKLFYQAHQLVHERIKYMFGEKLVTVHVVCPKLATATAVAINIASILGFKVTDHAEAKLF